MSETTDRSRRRVEKVEKGLSLDVSTGEISKRNKDAGASLFTEIQVLKANAYSEGVFFGI